MWWSEFHHRGNQRIWNLEEIKDLISSRFISSREKQWPQQEKSFHISDGQYLWQMLSTVYEYLLFQRPSTINDIQGYYFLYVATKSVYFSNTASIIWKCKIFWLITVLRIFTRLLGKFKQTIWNLSILLHFIKVN